jgi:hypothetical protein
MLGYCTNTPVFNFQLKSTAQLAVRRLVPVLQSAIALLRPLYCFTAPGEATHCLEDNKTYIQC